MDQYTDKNTETYSYCLCGKLNPVHHWCSLFITNHNRGPYNKDCLKTPNGTHLHPPSQWPLINKLDKNLPKISFDVV